MSGGAKLLSNFVDFKTNCKSIMPVASGGWWLPSAILVFLWLSRMSFSNPINPIHKYISRDLFFPWVFSVFQESLHFRYSASTVVFCRLSVSFFITSQTNFLCFIRWPSCHPCHVICKTVALKLFVLGVMTTWIHQFFPFISHSFCWGFCCVTKAACSYSKSSHSNAAEFLYCIVL